MKEEQRTFFNIMNSFRRMNLGSMLPNISHGEYGILKMIIICNEKCEDAENGVKVSHIVKYSKLPAPAVSRTMKGLEEKEYILRTVDKKDRRNTYVELTQKGKALMEEVDAIMSDFADTVIGQLGEETMRKLNHYLGKLVDTAEAEIEKRKYEAKKGEKDKNETHI